jgi:hypothetical protein
MDIESYGHFVATSSLLKKIIFTTLQPDSAAGAVLIYYLS